VDYSQYLPQLLVGAGAALQWARADKRFDDRIYAAVAVGLAVLAHLLVANYAQDARMLVISIIAALPQSLIAVLGGTGAVSVLSNIAVKSGFNPQSPAVPVTNSK
jgi:putative heme iron utilization protein